LTLTLHVTCYRNPCSLDLATGDPRFFQRLYSKRTESELIATLGISFHPALLYSSEFYFLWL
jgi:hypothetical protein